MKFTIKILLLSLIFINLNCNKTPYIGTYEYAGEENQFITNLKIDKMYFKVSEVKNEMPVKVYMLEMINDETGEKKEIGFLKEENGLLKAVDSLNSGIWINNNKIFMTVKIELFKGTSFGPWLNDNINYNEVEKNAPNKNLINTITNVPPDQILVQINNEVISKDEFNDMLNVSPQIARVFKNKPDKMKQFLDFIINQKLLVMKAKETGYDKDPEVEQEINKIRANLSKNKDTNLPDKEQYIERMKNLLMVNEMMKNIDKKEIKEFTQKLKDSAQIKINETLLSDLISSIAEKKVKK